jgi:Uma2 family endonuclease
MHTTAIPAPKLTYRDFVKFPDDGKRHELIDGVHYVSPSPITAHQRILGSLYFLVRQHLEQHPQGRLFLAPCDVIFTLFDIVVPDMLFIREERAAILTEKNIQGPPDLVVEIGSPGTRRRDEGAKLALYDRCGVAEYWFLDPGAETVRVYRRRAKALERVRELTAESNDALTSPLLAGMSIPLSRIFQK